MIVKRLSLVVLVFMLLVVLPMVGCSAFFEDYTYNPIGSDLSSSY